MKRLLICIFILSSVILGSTYSLHRLKEATEALNIYIDRCSSSYGSNSAQLDADISELQEYFGEYYIKTTFITRSASLEELSVSVTRLRYVLENEGGDFPAELDSIKVRAFLIYDSQVPKFTSIF